MRSTKPRLTYLLINKLKNKQAVKKLYILLNFKSPGTEFSIYAAVHKNASVTGCVSDLRFVSGRRRANVCVNVEVDEKNDDDRTVDDESPLHPQRKVATGVQCTGCQRHHQEELCLSSPWQRHN